MHDTSESIILDSINTAIILLNSDESMQYINNAAQQLFCVSSRQVLNKPFQTLFHNDNAFQELHNALDFSKQDQSIYTQHQITVTFHNLQTHTIDFSITPIEDQYIIEISTSNSLNTIQTKKTLHDTQSMSKEIIRNVAHEIKNPLAGLQGAAQLLSNETISKSHLDYVNIILSETQRLAQVVDNLLLLHNKSHLADINIHEVSERVISLLEIDIKANNRSIKLVKDYDPSIPNIFGDTTQLIQTALNIANNAIQSITAHQSSGTITFKTHIERNFTINTVCHKFLCKLDISDDGPGIEPEIKHSLFLPTITGKKQSTGLGLSIAQSIIQQHKGLISCASTPEKTTFSIYIPISTLK
jgi:two-component system, NtrC family, nitrogen regulation sensor histidine kinase GlnL